MRFSIGAAFGLASVVLLSACGDSVMLESVERRAAVADLPSCSAENHGEEIFVEDERMLYACGETGWAPFAKPADTTSAQTPLRSCGADMVPDDTASTCGEDGTFRDSRDGRIYKCVKIGDQTWMAENLDFGDTVWGTQTHASASYATKFCFDDDTTNCAKYGGLYQWATAMGLCSEYNSQLAREVIQRPHHRGICPAGWHVPTEEEWDALVEFVRSPTENDAGRVLKSKTGWDVKPICTSWENAPMPYCKTQNAGVNGDDTYGWNALPGGFVGNRSYFSPGIGFPANSSTHNIPVFMRTAAEFWTATEYNSEWAVRYSISAFADSAWSDISHKRMNSARSLRCVQD